MNEWLLYIQVALLSCLSKQQSIPRSSNTGKKNINISLLDVFRPTAQTTPHTFPFLKGNLFSKQGKHFTILHLQLHPTINTVNSGNSGHTFTNYATWKSSSFMWEYGLPYLTRFCQIILYCFLPHEKNTSIVWTSNKKYKTSLVCCFPSKSCIKLLLN